MITFKKILFYTFIFLLALNFYEALAAKPDIICSGLPGCNSSTSDKGAMTFLGKVISEGIKYVAVISVIAIMVAGIFYVVSVGEEERAKKAKKWIIWSIVGVVVSISAWSIINLLNLFRITGV